MGMILDASLTLAWCFADETTPKSLELLEKLGTEKAWVPSIWSLEIGNILLGAQKRNRISYSDIIQFIEMLKSLDIQIDLETTDKSFHEILSLAYSEKLTTYDAAYLELAMRTGFPLATKDHALIRAAQHLDLELLLI